MHNKARGQLDSEKFLKGERKKGVCKWFNVLKGFGFVTPEDGSMDIFVHQSVVHMEGFRSLEEGEEVEFVSKESDKGQEAVFICGRGGIHCQGSKRRPLPRRKSKKIKCYNCGEFGNHIAAKCPRGPLPKRCHHFANIYPMNCVKPDNTTEREGNMRTLIIFAVVISNLSFAYSYSNLTVDVDLDQQTGLKPYNVLVRFFIEKVVQPRGMSRFLDRAGIENRNDFDNYWKNTKWQTMVKDLSYVFIGFGIIGLLGVLTVIFIMFCGVITCCCRCCCTSKKDREPGNKDSCKRIVCGTFLFVLCLVVAAVGCIGIFSSNYLSQQIRYDNMMTDINSAFKVINPFIGMARKDLESDLKDVIVNAGDEVNRELFTFPIDTFERFDKSLKIKDSLSKITKACQQSTQLEQGFNNMGTGKGSYAGIKTSLDNSLTTSRNNINGLLTNAQCNVAECGQLLSQLPDLKTEADFSNLPDTTDAATSANNLGNYETAFNLALQRYERVENDIESVGRDRLDRASDEVDKIVQTAVSTYNDVDKKIGNIKLSDPVISPKAKDVTSKVSKIVGNALIGTFSMLLLITFLFVMGIFCGGALPLPKTQGGGCCNSRHGGRLLMAGVGLFFIFGWLFYLIATAFFLSGGVVQANVCRHLRNEDYDLNRIWDIAKGSINVDIIKNSSLKMTDFLASTRNAVPLYRALEIEKIKGLNISDALNLDKYDIKRLMQEISSISIDVNMEVFPVALQGPLDTVARNFDNVQLKEWSNELLKPVTKTPVGYFASKLRDIAIKVQEPLRTQLNTEANTLSGIEQGDVSSAESTKTSIDTATNQVGSIIGFDPFKLIVDSLKLGNDRLTTNGENEIKFAIGNQTLLIYQRVEGSAQQVIINVNDKIAPTKPLYLMYGSLRHVSCERVLLSFNSMWFSMGWVLFFLQISVILALSLSTLYRKEVPTNSVEPLREEKIPIFTSSEPQPRVGFTYKTKVHPDRDPI
ncbi:DgyrCDS13763 [Dimorphilus gyrociliatus]|uniref:DgyrCDS13763 n=1 Tax=Dimorphilus gyrociliatus TaxID=2664684 RepID=A0A7I8WBP0_9ANNE|nr:DgyrCDS13763 [Dimorphilus gyrociliatus]